MITPTIINLVRTLDSLYPDHTVLITEKIVKFRLSGELILSGKYRLAVHLGGAYLVDSRFTTQCALIEYLQKFIAREKLAQAGRNVLLDKLPEGVTTAYFERKQ